MSFDSIRRSEKGSITKRISRIQDGCEENCCDNKKVDHGVPVPEEPLGTGLPGFAYIYDTTQQVLFANDPVTFNTNGVITPAGFVTHVPGTAPITINQRGTYQITYEVFAFGTFSYAFALFNDDSQILGSNYGGNNAKVTTSGQVITILNAGDVLTLRALSVTNLFNITSAGIPVISASIIIDKIA